MSGNGVSRWHHDKCTCTRCTGFLPGHPQYNPDTAGRKPTHGAQQVALKLLPDAELIAQTVRPLMPVKNAAFEPTLQTYCILLVRVQRASDELARKEVEWEKKGEVDENGELVPLNYGHLQNYLSMWAGQALKYAKELGLTPAAAAQILRDARGEFPGGFRHPSADALDCLSVPKLRQLQKALAEALDEEDIIDAA